VLLLLLLQHAQGRPTILWSPISPTTNSTSTSSCTTTTASSSRSTAAPWANKAWLVLGAEGFGGLCCRL
jgi:hypothetical protein